MMKRIKKKKTDLAALFRHSLKVLLFCIFSISILTFLNAQGTACETMEVNISTGWNETFGSYNNAISYESNWKLIQIPPSSLDQTIPRSPVVINPNSAWEDLANAKWIASSIVTNQILNSCQTNPANGCDDCNPYVYEKCFCISETGKVEIEFDVMHDDYLEIILVDEFGSETSLYQACLNPPSGTGSYFKVPREIYQDLTLDAGKYCLQVGLSNVGNGPTGFTLEGAVTSEFIQKDTCCNIPAGEIIGIIYDDLNCNGQLDYNSSSISDDELVGWEVKLCDSNGNLIDQTLSSINGQYTFTEVIPGSYFVKVSTQTPLIPNIPSNGIAAIEILGSETINIDFGFSTTCPSSCSPVQDTCCSVPVDVLFVFDNSASISFVEFENMVSLAQKAMLEVDSAYCDAQFAVSHYAGRCGDEIIIQHDFNSATIAQSISRPGGFSSGGDDLNAALGTIKNAIDGTADPLILSSITQLNRRTGSNFMIVVFTDAGAYSEEDCVGGGSAMIPYTNSNILKTSPYDANFTLVHFLPGLTSVPAVGSAIASMGGTYSGIIDSNPGDPDNQIAPRQFIPADFTTTSINLLAAIPPCDSLKEFICCDDLIVETNLVVNPNVCCYEIGITNNISGSSIIALEVKILEQEWQFNNESLTLGSGFSWLGTPSNNSVSIEHSSGNIPPAFSPNALTYCLVTGSSNPSPTQNIVYNWIELLSDGTTRIACSDTIVLECSPVFPDPCIVVDEISIECNLDNPYEYYFNFTVTNNSDFIADKLILEDINPGYSFGFCSSNTSSTILGLPIGSIAPGDTSAPLCVKIQSPSAIWSSTDVCLKVGLFGEFDCCHALDSICVTLENCCDPCEKRDLVVEEIAEDAASCCYSIDIVDSCGYAYFTKIETEIITPDVIFGFHALGGPDAENWFVLPDSSDQRKITWWNNKSFIPYGTTDDIIQFCLSNIGNSSQIPQQVVVKWFAQIDTSSEEFVACIDTLEFDCAINVAYDCLDVSEQELTCVEDEEKYNYSFLLTNTSAIPFSADFMDVTIVEPSDLFFDPSGGVFPLPQPFDPGDTLTIDAFLKSIAGFPLAPQDLVLRYRLRFAEGDTCCYESILDTLILPPCGPPNCDSLFVNIDTSSTDDCCHSLEIYNSYTEEVALVELEVLTAGSYFVNYSTGGMNATDWYNPNVSSTQIQWGLSSGEPIPYGSTEGVMNFCLNNSDSNIGNQQVIIRWMDENSMEVCSDTLLFDCNNIDGIATYDCAKLSDLIFSCDESGDYDLSFSVENSSNLPRNADQLILLPVHDTIILSDTEFNLSPELIPGNIFSASTRISGAIAGDTLHFGLQLRNSQSIDQWGCFESDSVDIVIPSCCDPAAIIVYNGLSLNGDGINDFMKINGIETCSATTLTIYNRWGNIVHQQSDYNLGPEWDGSSKNGNILPQGTYFYILEFDDFQNQISGYLDIRY